MRLPKTEWKKLAATLGLGEFRQVRLAARGSTHDVYRADTIDRAYAVRIPRSAELAKHAQFSQAKADIWSLVSGNGAGPRYFGAHRTTARGSRFTVSVTEWLDGRPFDPIKDATRLGEALARLHSFTFSDRDPSGKGIDLGAFLHRWLNRQRRELPQTGLGAMLRDRLRLQLANSAALSARLGQRHCLVHNDLVSQNMIVSGGQVRLIDWDWAMWTNPATDLFCYLSPFVRSWERPFSLPANSVARFLGAYLATADRRVIAAARSRLDLWDAYNAGAAGWLCAEAPIRRKHFSSRAFHEWAFGEAADTGDSLRRAMSGDKAP